MKPRTEILALSFVILVQLCMGVWWASDLNRRVCTLEDWAGISKQNAQRIVKIEQENEVQTRDMSSVKISLDRIEAKLTDLSKAVWEHHAIQAQGGNNATGKK